MGLNVRLTRPDKMKEGFLSRDTRPWSLSRRRRRYILTVWLVPELELVRLRSCSLLDRLVGCQQGTGVSAAGPSADFGASHPSYQQCSEPAWQCPLRPPWACVRGTALLSRFQEGEWVRRPGPLTEVAGCSRRSVRDALADRVPPRSRTLASEDVHWPCERERPLL